MIKRVEAGAYSGICPGEGLNFFYRGGGLIYRLGLKTHEIDRFHWTRGGLSPHSLPDYALMF